jgi:hypothetical protein
VYSLTKHDYLKSIDLLAMAEYEGQKLTGREMVRAHLLIVFDLIKTGSLVVIATTGIHLSHHIHEMAHNGMIWRDSPGETDLVEHKH